MKVLIADDDAISRRVVEASLRRGGYEPVVAAGAYFFTGLAKLVFSGPAWVLSGNLRWVFYAASDARGMPNLVALFVADRPWLAHLVAMSTLVVELGFPVVLWKPRAAWFFVPGAVARLEIDVHPVLDRPRLRHRDEQHRRALPAQREARRDEHLGVVVVIDVPAEHVRTKWRQSR